MPLDMADEYQVRRIMKLRALGWTHKEIAEELNVSRQVVSYQLKQIKNNSSNIDAYLAHIVEDKEHENDLLLNELCMWLHEATNILRGPVEHADFKTYLFPILFLKRINDVWNEERDLALLEFGQDFPENHRFTIPEGSRWIDIRSCSKNIGNLIQKSMHQIEASNPNLTGIFGDAQWTNKERFTDEILKDIIEHFSKYTLGKNVTNEDLIGQAYEWVIKKFADMENKSAGEFYTPRSIIRLMIKIIKPDKESTIYDPACGTGGMLLEAVRFIRERDGDIRSIYGKLFGQEKNFITSSMARANLYLHGIEDFKIYRGDTLLNPLFIEDGSLKKFDIVLANPPFSLKNWGRDYWANDPWGRNSYGNPPETIGDYAWFEHMISSLNPNGRMGLILPQGALYRMGVEGEIRKKLVENDLIEGIIGLAPDLFYGTGVAASILIINKNKPALKKGKMLIINGEKQFWRGKEKNELHQKHVNYLFELYDAFDDVSGESKVVDIALIENNDWNLNIPRYVNPVLLEDSVSLEQAINNFKSNIELSERYRNKVKQLLTQNGFLRGGDE